MSLHTTTIQSFENDEKHAPLLELAGKTIKNVKFIPYKRVEIRLEDGTILMLRETQTDGDIEIAIYQLG